MCMHVYASVCVHALIGETQTTHRSGETLHSRRDSCFAERWWRYDNGNNQEVLQKRQIKGQKEGRETKVACSWLVNQGPAPRVGFRLMHITCTASIFRPHCQSNPT